MNFRNARLEDAERIAALHANSWKIYYRGAFPDKYLDEIVDKERLDTWQKRLAEETFRSSTFLAEDAGELIGFVCMQLDFDEYGTLLDNLHVNQKFHGKQTGRRLMKLGATYTEQYAKDKRIHLYVLTQNEQAIQFYEKCLGRQDEALVDEELTEICDRKREIKVYRYVWDTPKALIDAVNV